MAESGADLTEDAFLGGRLSLLQQKHGFRAGLDAVMLAAAIPAEAGECSLEAGLGNGASSLCLLARVADLQATGVEIDDETAQLAATNAARNGFAGHLQVLAGDVEAPGAAWAGRLTPNSFDHVFANPPFHRLEETRAPSDSRKAVAHQRAGESLDRWVRFLITHAKAGASITLILPAAALDEGLDVLSSRAGDIVLFPLFPRPGVRASRVILQGRKGSRAPLRLSPGLVLHAEGHDFAPEADAVLRHGAALNL